VDTPTDKPTVRVLLVVDRSGSMGKLAATVRDGINEYVATLRADKDVRYRVTLVLFDHEWTLLCENVKPKAVPALITENYYARGMTALWYAVGRTIDNFERNTGPLDQDEKVILVVNTDGQENASHQLVDLETQLTLYDRDKVAAMLKEREERGWTTLYLGQGPAAWGAGHEFGNRVETHSTTSGTRNTYTGLSSYTQKVSRGMHANTAAADLAVEANKDEAAA
jgi:hypothetical protein